MFKQFFKDLYHHFRRENGLILLRNLYERYLTAEGKAVLLVFLISLSLGLVGTEILIYIFFCTLFGMAITACLFGFFLRPRFLKLTFKNNLPILAGENSPIELKVKNKHRFPQIQIQGGLVFEKHPNIFFQNTLSLAKEGEDIWSVNFEPPRRGIYKISEIQVYSTFPLGLFRWWHRFPIAHQIIVYPKYRQIQYLTLRLERKYQPGGLIMTSNVGDSMEFKGLRNYIEGDNPKHIHWSSYAKTGKLATREYQEEFFVRLGLVFDASLRSEIQKKHPIKCEEAFEAAISLTASVANWIDQQEYLLDIFASGSQMIHFQSGRSLSPFEQVLEKLACIELEYATGTEALAAKLHPYLGQLSAVIFIFLDFGESQKKLLQPFLAQGLTIRILLIQPSETSAPEAIPFEGVSILQPHEWESVNL